MFLPTPKACILLQDIHTSLVTPYPDYTTLSRLLAQCITQTILCLEDAVGTRIPLLRRLVTVCFCFETATVTVSLSYKELRFNPGFFTQHIKTVNDLAFVLLHERGHIVLNHIVDTSSVTCFEEDAVINPLATCITGSDLTGRVYTTGVHLVLQNNSRLLENLMTDPVFAVEPAQAVLSWHTGAYGYRRIHQQGILDAMMCIRVWRENTTDPACFKFSTYSPDGSADSLEFSPSTGKDSSQLPAAPKDASYISFASLHLPSDVTFLPMEEQLLGIANLQSTGDHTGLITTISGAMGGGFDITRMDSTHPQRVSSGDAQRLALGYLPSEWEHVEFPTYEKGDIYLDFSQSMKPYWGTVLGIAKTLRFRVQNMYGFASTLVKLDLSQPGIKVGKSTELNPVITQMEKSNTNVVIWVTDLDFWPTVASSIETNILPPLIRRLTSLIVCCPGVVGSSEKLMQTHFGNLPPHILRKVNILII